MKIFTRKHLNKKYNNIISKILFYTKNNNNKIVAKCQIQDKKNINFQNYLYFVILKLVV